MKLAQNGLGLFAAAAVLAVGSTPAFADDIAATSSTVKRSGRISITLPVLTGSGFSGEGSGTRGFGLNGVYELYFTPRFTVGIPLAYRSFSSEKEKFSQIGYGFLLKHSFGEAGAEAFRPFLEYGLLFNISRLSGASARPGSGTAHDTRLAVGADFTFAGAPLTIDIGYHFSTLRYFELPSVNLNYFQVGFGFRLGE